MAVAGDRVVVSDVAGLVRSEGDRFVTLWQDPTAVAQPAFGVAHGETPDAVLAVNADRGLAPSGARE